MPNTRRMQQAASGVGGRGTFDYGGEGELWVVGENHAGALGLGDTVHRSELTQVGSRKDWVRCSSGMEGYGRTGAIDSSGRLYTWGEGSSGVLGHGNTTDYSSPVQVGVDTDWQDIHMAANFHSIALKGGRVYMCGKDEYGKLGGIGSVNVFTQIGALTDWTDVGQGYWNPTAINSSHQMFAWGYNGTGACGDGTYDGDGAAPLARSSPVLVTGSHAWAKSDGGEQWNVGITNSGGLYTWGIGGSGRTGQGDNYNNHTPEQIASGVFTDCAAGSSGGGAIKSDGTLWTWGTDSFNADNVARSSPVQQGSDTDWYKVTYQASSGCGMKTDGTVWVWGTTDGGAAGGQYGTSITRTGSLDATEAFNGDLFNYIGPSQRGHLTSFIKSI